MESKYEQLAIWLSNARSLAKEVRESARTRGVLSIFTISTTVKPSASGLPYITPMRDLTHGCVAGAVVFSQAEAVLLARTVDGLVDWILVDAEKKLGLTIGIDEELVTSFGLTSTSRKLANDYVEFGNLSSACQEVIKQSKFREFKPNDLTVEAVWNTLSAYFRVLSGKQMAILGAGNIGFKLALKLVESGVSVELVRRNEGKGTLLANTINVVKPKGTFAGARFSADPLAASVHCDALIGCTNGVPVITSDMIRCMHPKGLVIDVGKGSVHADALDTSLAFEVPVVRCDVSASIEGLVSSLVRHDEIVAMGMGRRELQRGVFLVSGGYMGRPGDIVVNNFLEPTKIIGVANGSGDFRAEQDAMDKDRISVIKKMFNIP